MAYTNNNNGLLYYSNIGIKYENRNISIGAFDLDGTLITPNGKRTFSKDKFDWKPLYNNVKLTMELMQDDYLIVIFTNQKALSSKEDPQQEYSDFFEKVHTVMKTYCVTEYAVYAAIKDNRFRKPMTGMYDQFLADHKIASNKINSDSFYCGDAAGRIRINVFKQDFSSSDYNFASNIGLQFKTPEQLFNIPATKNDLYYMSSKYDYIGKDLWFNKQTPLYDSDEYKQIIDFCTTQPEVKKIIIMVGKPASGKSSLALHLGRRFINNNMVYLSNDVHGQIDKKFARFAAEGKNLIIDNTNTDQNTRNKLYNLTPDYNKMIIYFKFPEDVCKHLNYYRSEMNPNKELISHIVYARINKNFTDPHEDTHIANLKIIDISYGMITPYLNKNKFMNMYIDN